MEQHLTTEPLPRPSTPRRYSLIGQKQSQNPGMTTARKASTNEEHHYPGLYARDRNPRRKATRQFGDVPDPKPQKQRRTKSPMPMSPQPDAIAPTKQKKRKQLSQPRRSAKKPRKASGVSNGIPDSQLNEASVNEPTALNAGRSHDEAFITPQEAQTQDLPPPALNPREPTAEVPNKALISSKPLHETLARYQGEPNPERPQTSGESMIKTEVPDDAEPIQEETLEHAQVTVQPSDIENETIPTCDQAPLQPVKSESPEHEQNPHTDAVLDVRPTQRHAPGTGPVPKLPNTSKTGCLHQSHGFLPRRPARNVGEYVEYVEQIKILLREKSLVEPPIVATRQASRILGLLEVAKPADHHDAAFMSGPEAAKHLAIQSNGVIVTEGQQLLPLQTINQFLGEYYDDKTKVWIQDPSVKPNEQSSVRLVTMAQIKKRFAAPPPGKEPWNLLELATHCDDGLRPIFLNTEDCRLLTKLKIPHSAKEARRRTYSPGYKEVEKWALLAQAGALTEPHQDSHGYSTFITLNVGRIGFGWLSRPSPRERAAWCAEPQSYLGGNWRYIILRPGQTVYFPSGTVHFVFRLPSAGNSLAFGGHVLRCSAIVDWVRTMLEEKGHPSVANEEITQSAPGYLAQVEKFVKQALKSGDEECLAKWGGVEAIEEFLRLKKEFMEK